MEGFVEYLKMRLWSEFVFGSPQNVVVFPNIYTFPSNNEFIMRNGVTLADSGSRKNYTEYNVW